VIRAATHILAAATPILGIGWLLDLPQYFGQALTEPQYLCLMAGVASGAGLLLKPYFKQATAGELILAVVAILAWAWAAWNYNDWLIDAASRGIERWLPAVFALALMLEALRKNCGIAIALLVWACISYGLLGHLFPGVFETPYTQPSRLVLYLYADSNGVPGLVLDVAASIVLGFILFGKMMEISGATNFFNGVALATMGHRRGGPAKVAVVASSAFGTISGSTVGNIMSTGIVTIPLMKKSGFPPHYAGAVEAVASNGGQLAPPIMGTTAFLIAEFLQVSYGTVVLAAIVPAALYFLVLFIQVDAFSARHGIHGLKRSELPRLAEVTRSGWVYLLPVAFLLYVMFWENYSPGKSALYAAAALLVLWAVRTRHVPTGAEVRDMFVGSGQGIVPLFLICGGAGIVIGVLNITGLGFSIALALTHIAESGGLFAMLLATAALAIVLGMGMPTAAVYVVLSVILAPALVKVGVPEMAAHLFIFYFGLLSMLTPPVAVASFVAAGLAGADMWRTGIAGVKLASAAYLVPFLFVYNPALLGYGDTTSVALAVLSAVAGAYLLARASEPGVGWNALGRRIVANATMVMAIFVGGSTIWFGPTSPIVAVLVIATAVYAGYEKVAARRRVRSAAL
jgi:TRAP transporter 4TM/12TM fusion protein